jgi:hypothetical protein
VKLPRLTKWRVSTSLLSLVSVYSCIDPSDRGQAFHNSPNVKEEKAQRGHGDRKQAFDCAGSVSPGRPVGAEVLTRNWSSQSSI